MEEMKSESCGAGCNCGKPAGNSKVKAAVCLVVLLAVCGIFVYKAMSDKQAAPITPAVASTEFAASVVGATEQKSQEMPVVKEAAETQSNGMYGPLAVKVEEKSIVGQSLDSLETLNTIAANQDTVFVFVPAKDKDTAKATTDAIASSEKKLTATGAKIGLYTLKSGSAEYDNIAEQLKVPSMLVMSKGKGVGTVTGEITETKILQAYVASSKAGGCGPSSAGCGPSSAGCGPSSAGCK